MGAWHIMEGGTSLGAYDGPVPPPVLADQTLVAVEIEAGKSARDYLPVLGDDGGYTVMPRPVSLEEARAARWVEALAYRNAQQEAGCATPLGRVQTDADSQRKITGAVTAAIAAQGAGIAFTPIDWTMEDNAIVSHDGPAMIAMGMAVVAYLNTCQTAGNAIRAAIDAAADAAAVLAVDITAGYPT